MTRKTITLRVTRNHIDRGTHDNDACPLARALLDRNFISPWIDYEGWQAFDPENAKTLYGHITASQQQFISDYDLGLPVEPRTFRLQIDG